jgi:hypothetical protein
MLDVFYKDFVKARVAGFTRVLADAARGDPAGGVLGDALCASLFTEAGEMLGSMARTLATGLLPVPLQPTGDGSAERTLDVHELDIVCVGELNFHRFCFSLCGSGGLINKRVSNFLPKNCFAHLPACRKRMEVMGPAAVRVCVVVHCPFPQPSIRGGAHSLLPAAAADAVLRSGRRVARCTRLRVRPTNHFLGQHCGPLRPQQILIQMII